MASLKKNSELMSYSIMTDCKQSPQNQQQEWMSILSILFNIVLQKNRTIRQQKEINILNLRKEGESIQIAQSFI